MNKLKLFKPPKLLRPVIIVFIALVIVACKGVPGLAPKATTPISTSPVATSTPPLAGTAKPSDTPIPTATAPAFSPVPNVITPSATAVVETPTPVPCLKLLTPKDGEVLRGNGIVTLTWEAQPGAISYRVEISAPNSWLVHLNTADLKLTRTMPASQPGQVYTWSVVALDPNGVEICRAGPQTFGNQVLTPSETKERPDFPFPGNNDEGFWWFIG